MKFTIKKEVLMDALNKVSKAISSRNVIPVLAGIKFDLTSKKLVLTASDNDITIQTFIECNDEEIIKVKEEGSIIIQGKYILDIVRKLPDKYINIEVVDELKILIYTANSEFNLNGISESEYPNIDLGESKNHIELSADILKEIVNQTSFATSIDENKAILNGINFNINADILECNATDSYRLARKIIKLEKPSKENQNIVIPSRNLVEFTRIIEDNKDNLVYITDTGYINKKNFKLLTNKNIYYIESNHDEKMLMDGPYPYYLKQRIISDEGHLSNTTTAKYLKELIGKDTKYIILAHLSEHNNTEQLALEATKEALKDLTFNPKVLVAKQNESLEEIEVLQDYDQVNMCR